MAVRVVLLHGFTQTHVSWDPVASLLRPSLAVEALDLPGHGSGPPVPHDLAEAAALVGDHGGHAVYVGYSLGGRVALRLALDRPDLVEGLVLLGATAGIDDAPGRSARRDADEALAERIVRDGTAAFLATWMAQPLFADLEVRTDDRDARLANSPAGLAASLRRMGTGTMDPPWWDDLHRLAMPVAVMAGEHDTKFVALGQRLTDQIGANATFEIIDGVGHAAHLQAPDEFATRVRAFVASLRA